jgi:hypothetical protein
MGGKAALIVVIGFGILLGYVSNNMSVIATRAQGNMSIYTAATESHNLAITGANVGLCRLYQDTSWRGTETQTPTASLNGSFTYTINTGSNGRPLLRSISTFRGPSEILHDTVEVAFGANQLQSFSLFAWMTNFEGNVFWITGDTVRGRVHSNGQMHMNGTPTFMEKLTTSKGIDPKPGVGTNKAVFKKGFETGVADVKFPTDLSLIASAATTGGRFYTGNVEVKLKAGSTSDGDGYALVYDSGGSLIDSVGMNDASFDGVIGASGAVSVSGTLDGKLSIYSPQQIYVVGSTLYADRTTTSNDILGLVCENDIAIKDNAKNSSDCSLDGCIFSRAGSFGAENYNSGNPRGRLHILGSVVQDTRGAVGTFNGNAIKTGYLKDYRFDSRLADPSFRPPAFPGFYTQTYAIGSWWESVHIPKFN